MRESLLRCKTSDAAVSTELHAVCRLLHVSRGRPLLSKTDLHGAPALSQVRNGM